MSGANSTYFRSRAAKEMAAAEAASSELTASIHRALAERYLNLAGDDAAFVRQSNGSNHR